MKQVRLVNVCAVAAVMVLCGCGQRGTSSGVAVIDLDKVAQAMGWMDELSKNLQAADAAMRTELDQVLKANINAIEVTKKEVAAEAKLTAEQIKVLNSIQDNRELAQLPLTAAQREKLITSVNSANTRWQAALNTYQQQIQQRRAALVLSYREKVLPYARRVAAERGFVVVMTKGDNLLLAEPVADITDAVIDELQKSEPPRSGTTSFSPAPKVEGN